MGPSTPGSGRSLLASPDSAASSNWTRPGGEVLSSSGDGEDSADADGGGGEEEDDEEGSSVARLAKRLEFLPARVRVFG